MTENRIKLINCDKDLLEIIIKGEAALSNYLNITIPNKWTEFGEYIFNYTRDQLLKNLQDKKWWTYLPILIESNTLIGSCGYKGPPDSYGIVEIGYEVAQDYRNQGYATEIAQLLIDQAFAHKEIKGIRAHTLAEENASCKVLKNCNFTWIKKLHDKEDGDIWRWELTKPQFTISHS